MAQPSTAEDLFDVTQGAQVTASSGIYPGYSAAAMLGENGQSPGYPWGITYFEDNQPPGTVHFIEWELPGLVDLSQIRLYAYGDDFLNFGREFEQFVLKAKSEGSSTYDITIVSYNASHPYIFLDPFNALLVEETFPVVVSKSFRAEFVQYTAGYGFDGPRILELDGFGPPPPVIVTQPESLIVNYGMPASFSVTATGTGTLSYQWYRDGTPIAGATSATLQIDPVTHSHTGAYFVSVTDANGNKISAPATLGLDLLNAVQSRHDLWDLNRGSVITSHSALHPVAGSIEGTFGGFGPLPQSDWTYFADNQPTGTVHFVEWTIPSPSTVRSLRLFAHGDPELNHGREFESVTIRAKSAGSPTFDLVVGTFTPGHPYSFLDHDLILDTAITPITASAFRAEFAQYTAGYGFDGPRIIELDAFSTQPLLRPTVVSHPESKTVSKNSRVTLKVVGRGGNLSYQWKFMGQPINNATTDTLIIKHAKATDQGYYTVVVSNPVASVESAQALLLVIRQ